MADEFSFDVESVVDIQKVDDAVNACNREISVRYDFRGSISKFEFDRQKGEITLHSDDEGKLQSVVQILQSKSARQGINLKAYDFQKIDAALGGKVRQLVKVKQGIPQEKAKAMVADIKAQKMKVTPSIQSDKIRVSSKSKDNLQDVMALLNKKDYGLPLQFTNYR